MKDKSVGERYPRWFISRHRKGQPELVDISDGARDVFQGVKFSTAETLIAARNLYLDGLMGAFLAEPEAIHKAHYETTDH